MQHNEVYINLPVADVARSREFFTALGYTIEERVSDERSVAIVLGRGLNVMLLRQDFFDTFLRGRAARPGDHEVLLVLDVDSPEAVDAHVEAALAAGGTEVSSERHGDWMYWRSFADPDGHIWESIWMDVNAARAAGEFGG